MKFTILLAFVTATIFVNVSNASTVEETCRTSHSPTKILSPLLCDGQSEVYILGESAHQDTSAVLLKGQVSDLHQSGHLAAFLEGSTYSGYDGSYPMGLEDPFIYALSGLLIAKPVFDRFSKVPPDKSPDTLFVLRRTKSDLITGLFMLPELWGDLDWIPKQLTGKEDGDISAMLRYLRTIPINQRRAAAKENLRFIRIDDWANNFNDYSALAETAKLLIERAQKFIAADTRFSFLNSSELGSVLGEGRNIIFSKAVLDSYCEVAKTKKPIWIQIGAGHAKGVQCLLKEFLPRDTPVKMKSASDYATTYQNWKKDLESTTLKSVRDFAARNDVKVETGTAERANEVTLFLHFAGKKVNQSDFVQIIQKDGYKVLSLKSIEGSPNSFGVIVFTFDPTN